MSKSKSRRNFSDWLKAYTEWNSISEAPPSFHYWVGVSVIAGALRRRVWIDQLKFQWTPNFYIVLVAPAGVVTKSTAIRIGINLLRQVDGIKFGPASMTWQALTEAISEAQELIPLEKPQHNGVPTADQLLDAPMLPMSPITCSVNELGTFLDPSDQKLVDVMTDLWDGQLETWEHKTKTQGTTTIENPWINLIAATTPSWLSHNVPESMVGGGLTSRIIFIHATHKHQHIPFPAELVPTAEHEEIERRLVEDLQQISEILGEYKPTKEAIEWVSDWYKNDIWNPDKDRPEHLASGRFDGYIARKQTHLMKIAMVLAASQRDELIITEHDVIKAERLLSRAELDMAKVFESIGSSDENKNVTHITSFLRGYGGKLDGGVLFQKCLPIMSSKDFNEAVASAVRAGILSIHNTGSKLIYTLEK